MHQVARGPLAGVEARSGSGHYGIFDHGAHAWAWQPDGQRSVLWLSRHSRFTHGHAVRGGVPVVFPWFGTGPGWNPGVAKAAAMADFGDEWSQMICLEAANIGDHAVTLQPGEGHLLSQRVTPA